MKRSPAPPALPKEAERLQALRSYDILDTPPEEAFEELVTLAGQLLDMPISLISLIDEGRQWFKARVGLAAPETPRDQSFCVHALAANDLLVVEDASTDDRFKHNPLVTSDPNIRFYAGAPLVNAEGHGLGALCVIDRVPRTLTAEQSAVLKVLSRQVMTQLELRRLLARSRREQEALTEVLNALPAAVFITDLDGIATFQNDAVRDLVGDHGGDSGTMQEFWRSTKVKDRSGHVLAPEDWPALRAIAGHPVAGQDLLLELPDGRILPILLGAAPLRDTEERIVGAVVGFQDVTALHELSRLKNDFVSTVSHELRTPLTSIRGSLQLLLADDEAVVTEDGRSLAAVALNSTDRLVRIITDILDVAKIEAGQLPLDLKTSAVSDLVRAACDAVQGFATDRGVTIEQAVPADLPTVDVDQDRLVQSIINLLSNAAKFSTTGGTVRVEGSQANDGQVQISVIDHGRGIPETEIHRVFEKFHQVGGVDRQGTGLGLPITKALVEQHGGRIWASSELGVGTTFTILLPASRP